MDSVSASGAQTQRGQKSTLTLSARKRRKKASDKKYRLTKVALSESFDAWKDLKESGGWTHGELAAHLLDTCAQTLLYCTELQEAKFILVQKCLWAYLTQGPGCLVTGLTTTQSLRLRENFPPGTSQSHRCVIQLSSIATPNLGGCVLPAFDMFPVLELWDADYPSGNMANLANLGATP
ncbi:hypothetical protein HOLleu_35521 [Holothuria leucospilota]|uniref:Uncharacterized protein n=1 Tax=Holothuria leucospilota TaxID=206669 RepID=A0A9Q1BGX4_HOLLE|nr:hypothetical protein HOLleu_35521 [Holothuria leucospilota]